MNDRETFGMINIPVIRKGITTEEQKKNMMYHQMILKTVGFWIFFIFLQRIYLWYRGLAPNVLNVFLNFTKNLLMASKE